MDIFGLETKPAEPTREEMERQLDDLFALRLRTRRKAVVRLSIIFYTLYIAVIVLIAVLFSKNDRETGALAGIGGGLAFLLHVIIEAIADRTPSVRKLNEDIEALNKKLYPEFFENLKKQAPVRTKSPGVKRANIIGGVISGLGVLVTFSCGIPVAIVFGAVGALVITGGIVICSYGLSILFTKDCKFGIKAVFVPGGLLILPIAVLLLQFGQSEGFESWGIPAGVLSGIALYIIAILVLTHPQRKAKLLLKLRYKDYWALASQKEGILTEVYNKKGDRAEISVCVDNRYTVSLYKKEGGDSVPVGEKSQFFSYVSALGNAVVRLLSLWQTDDGRPEDGFAHRYDAIREIAQALSVFSFLEGKIAVKEDYESITISFHRCLEMEINEAAVLVNGAYFMTDWNKDMIMDLMSKLLNEEIILFEQRRKKIFFPRQALDWLVNKYRNKKCRIYSGINVYLEPEEKRKG